MHDRCEMHDHGQNGVGPGPDHGRERGRGGRRAATTCAAYTPPVPAAALEVTGLVKRYGDRTVVDGLDLSAAGGAVTAVLGPNGAGKTTTIECCEGLRRPDAGDVRVLGLDPARQGPELRARVGVMLQDGGLTTGARAGDLLDHVA